MIVHECEEVGQDGSKFMDFETISLAPIDRRLVDAALLTPAERGRLNGYHARVLAEIGPHLDTRTREWLEWATAPI